MLIRSATVEDKGAIAELLRQLDYEMPEEQIARKIDLLTSHPDALLLIAEDEGGVQGFISLHFIPQVALDGDFCRISYFCVGEGRAQQGCGRPAGSRRRAGGRGAALRPDRGALPYAADARA